MSCSRLACKITAAYGRVKGGDKKPLPQPFQTLYTGKWIMYNNGPVTASSFSFQKRTAVPIKEAVAAFLLYFQPPLAVFLDFNSFPNILRPEFPMCSTPVCGILCGQKQSLAGAIPAGLCGILGSLLFHSVNNTKTALGPPHEVECHNQRKQPAQREIFREARS